MKIKMFETEEVVITKLKWATYYRTQPYFPDLNNNNEFSRKRFVGQVDDNKRTFFLRRSKKYFDLLLPAILVKGKVMNGIISLTFIPGISTIIAFILVILVLLSNFQYFNPKINEYAVDSYVGTIILIGFFVLWVSSEIKLIRDGLKKVLNS